MDRNVWQRRVVISNARQGDRKLHHLIPKQSENSMVKSRPVRKVPVQNVPVPLQPCYWLLSQLPGLSEADAAAWETIGIVNTAQLLQAGQTPQQQNALATQLKLPRQQVRKWIAIAHLAQLPAVGCTHCGLLLHAGIVSIPQLAQTSAPKLHATLMRFQVAQFQRRDLCPTLEEIQSWIGQARQFSHR